MHPPSTASGAGSGAVRPTLLLVAAGVPLLALAGPVVVMIRGLGHVRRVVFERL